MRFIRSIVFAGLALAAMAVCAATPAAASVPIDPGIHVMSPAKAEYPAQTIVTDDHVALTCESPSATFRVFIRSIQGADALNLASADGSRSRFLDLRRRC